MPDSTPQPPPRTVETPLLEISHLTAGYGTSAGSGARAPAAARAGGDVLEDVHLACAPGEMVAIIGPNGAGKSTLLRAIFGQARVRAGSIEFAGLSVVGEKPAHIVARGLSYVPQLANVFPNLSVEDNLQMGALAGRRRGWRAPGRGQRERTNRDHARRLEEVIELFPLLAERRRQPAGQLSGGQRQMVALGRALMLEPRMLLLDEPSAGLAPDFVDLMFDKIASIGARGVSIVLVEQNARKALTLADTVYVLAGGRNVMVGSAHAVAGDARIARLYLGGAAADG